MSRPSRSPRTAVVLALTLGAACAVPATVQAGQIFQSDAHGRTPSSTSFVAGPGERNDLTISIFHGEELWHARDAGAPLTVGGGRCALGLGDYFACTLESVLNVDGGDRDDRLHVFGVRHNPVGADARIDGGPGNDTILGDVESDAFVLSAGSDTIDGGSGPDEIDVDATDGPAAVDLAKGTATTAHRRATLTRVENAAIGSGTVSGTDRANRLTIRRGTATGRAGNDTIDARGPDTAVDCGPGRDVVIVAHASLAQAPALLPNCEVVQPQPGYAFDAAPRISRSGRTVQIRLRCAPSASTRCRGSIHVPGLGGSPRFTVRAGRSAWITVTGRGPVKPSRGFVIGGKVLDPGGRGVAMAWRRVDAFDRSATR
jgi:hypothetical protein